MVGGSNKYFASYVFPSYPPGNILFFNKRKTHDLIIGLYVSIVLLYNLSYKQGQKRP